MCLMWPASKAEARASWHPPSLTETFERNQHADYGTQRLVWRVAWGTKNAVLQAETPPRGLICGLRSWASKHAIIYEELIQPAAAACSLPSLPSEQTHIKIYQPAASAPWPPPSPRPHWPSTAARPSQRRRTICAFRVYRLVVRV